MRRESALVPFFFLAAVFCATFEKVQWNVAGSVFLADVTALGFLVFFALDRLGRSSGRVPRTAAVLLAFLGAFLLVYLIGFFNLETTQALDQFGKGIAKWLIRQCGLLLCDEVIAKPGRRRGSFVADEGVSCWLPIRGITTAGRRCDATARIAGSPWRVERAGQMDCAPAGAWTG